MTAKPKTADLPAHVDELCDRFEDALQQGSRPDLAEYLAAAGPMAAAALPDLAALELHYRLAVGEAVAANDYFDAHPELRADPIAALRLVGAEYRAAVERDPAITESVFRLRYPDLADESEWRNGPWSAPRVQTHSVVAGPDVLQGVLDPPDPDHPDDLGRLGEYRILEVLGRGAMGIVYRGRDPMLNRDVAIKVLLQGWSTTGSTAAYRRFKAEAQITGQLQHPGIPAVYRVGELPDGRPFLVMKLIKGRTLDVLLKERPDPSADRGQFVATFEQLCQAVGYAHAHGVLHRDLKPANVMIGAFGEVQVTDWGLAKALTAPGSPLDEAADDPVSITVIHSQRGAGETTQAGSVLGTPAYMAPEQAIGAVDHLDARTDVFGLGAVLCVILTGKPPYVGSDAESTRQSAARAQLIDAFTRLDECGAEPELIALCKVCLSAERGHRPADAGKVAATVAELRAASGERARQAEVERERAVVREAEGRKRRRLAAGLVALIGVALATGTATTYKKYQGEAAQLAVANEQRKKAENAYDRTRAALDAMTSGVAGDSLATQQDITPEQKKFLAEVLPFYRDFADEEADDERARERTAAAAAQVGRIHKLLGHKAESAEAFRTARDEYEKLVADFPMRPEYRQKQARSHNNLGHQFAALRQREEAESEYRAALAIQEKLVADDPKEPSYRLELARSHNSLGVVLGLGRMQPKAEIEYRAALAIQKKLVTDDSTNPTYRQELATSHNNLGICLKSLKRLPEAGDEFRIALLIQEQLVADFRAVHAYRQELARSYNNLGILLKDLKKWAEAEIEYGKALALREQLVTNFPGVPAYRSDLNTSYYDFARLYAVLSGQETDKKQEYANRAMELLRKAADAGWKDAAHMQKDPDLDPLRKRADFQKLLADLEAKLKSKEPDPPSRTAK